MLPPSEAKEKLGRKYDQKVREWAVLGAENPVVDIPLHPPTQEQVLAQPAESAAWVRAWREAERSLTDGGRLVWASRKWANAGGQRIPTRLVLEKPSDVAAFISRKGHWRAAEQRAAELRHLLTGQGNSGVSSSSAAEEVQPVLHRLAAKIADLDRNEYVRLRDALAWLLKNPQPGIYPRQMPIRGVDSKWLEKRSSLVEPLYASAAGTADLGLLEPPRLIRMRLLDQALAPGLPRDLSTPVEELDALQLDIRASIVVENLQTVLALPPLPGVVALHGTGYTAHRVSSINWLAAAPLVYWGDLDADGYQILSRVRSHLPHTRSALMDRRTLTEHLDLAGPDRKDAPRSVMQHLTGTERDGFAALTEHGNLRLEQERIPWEYALKRLHEALAAVSPSS
ncbi:DUF3322 domain-containing protein [Sediminivirga luteola]|uniref:DUF3322 domain-containing protein n=1 Tax=Sediminivirga luteola TaxID=1774748 RepID=UPI001F58E36B|nr:Wadjet anti-phage system protein JetD domain-containing protein [Sediminivirga luteola]MCI2266158.1 DUF2220 family protein [Sediminivirga luteola]